MTIAYAIETDLRADEFIDVLVRSTLAERRPVGLRPQMAASPAPHGGIVTLIGSR